MAQLWLTLNFFSKISLDTLLLPRMIQLERLSLLRTVIQIQHFRILLLRSKRWRTTLDYKMPSSPHLPLWLWTRCQNPRFYPYLTLPDRQGYCDPSKISWPIWVLYCDELPLNLSHNKCFWLLSRHYGPVRTREAQVPELDSVTRLSVRLLNHTPSEAMHNVSTHQLPRYNQP